ncbi:Rv1733c family protein [Streptomyces yanii]|uniref:Rv1733c family protein n=1 Tax=Streptomyces yanii TaxID=78510 RepID=UPI0033786F4D
MRAVSGVWRWRHNPLRRATDRREAWVALVALLLMTVAAPALGWLCGSRTDDVLQESVRIQQAQRHATTAVVVRVASGPPRLVSDPEVSSERTTQTSVVARWKAPDGTPRSGRVATFSKITDPGARVRIWTDSDGRPALRPMDAPTAHTHAALAGFGVMLLGIALIEGGRRLIVWRMVQRRYARLDRAWAEAGPDWGRTGTGS